MVHPLGITRHLAADDAFRIAVVFGPADAPDTIGRDDLDVECTCARAVMRADRICDIKRHYVTLQCCIFDKYMRTRSARQF